MLAEETHAFSPWLNPNEQNASLSKPTRTSPAGCPPALASPEIFKWVLSGAVNSPVTKQRRSGPDDISFSESPRRNSRHQSCHESCSKGIADSMRKVTRSFGLTLWRAQSWRMASTAVALQRRLAAGRKRGTDEDASCTKRRKNPCFSLR